MIGIWQVYDKYMTGMWQVYDRYMTGIWQVYDRYMIGIWLNLRRWRPRHWPAWRRRRRHCRAASRVLLTGSTPSRVALTGWTLSRVLLTGSTQVTRIAGRTAPVTPADTCVACSAPRAARRGAGPHWGGCHPEAERLSYVCVSTEEYEWLRDGRKEWYRKELCW